MKRFVSSFLTLSLILSPILYGQDAKKDGGKDLPKSVTNILNDAEKNALSLRTTYEEGLLKVFQASEKKMLEEQSKLTKSGDLEGALMIKEKIATFKKEISEKMDNVGKENWKENGGKDQNLFNKIVIWNATYENQDYGIDVCDISLFKNNKIVWYKNEQKLNWNKDASAETVITYPRGNYDKLRIDIKDKKWIVSGGGLCEVQMFVDGKNILKNSIVNVSGKYSKKFNENSLTDDILDWKKSIWLLPNGTAGWVEVDINKKY